MGGVKLERVVVGIAETELSEVDLAWDQPGESSGWTAQLAVGTIDKPFEAGRPIGPPPIPLAALLPRGRPPLPPHPVPAGTGSVAAHPGTWAPPPSTAIVAPGKRDHDATVIVKPLPTTAPRRLSRRTKAIAAGALAGLTLGSLLLVMTPRHHARHAQPSPATRPPAPAAATAIPRARAPSPKPPAAPDRRAAPTQPVPKKRVALQRAKQPGSPALKRPAVKRPVRTASVPGRTAGGRPPATPPRPPATRPAAGKPGPRKPAAGKPVAGKAKVAAPARTRPPAR